MSSLELPTLVSGVVVMEFELVDKQPVGVKERMTVSYHVRGSQL